MSKIGDELSGLLSRDKTNIVLLHNTDSLARAKAILKNGFRYESQLTYSTDRINPLDTVEINYFLVERKEYGDFTIIIEISKQIINKYSAIAEVEGSSIEELISIDQPFLSENDEYIYTLPHYYIKGILNNKTGEVLLNPVFDPDFDSPDYLGNLNRKRI
ncbi:MAG: hypothetical protein V2I37_00270 [Marinilabiliaceae bacterium]|jgi:hypothetical protein|nr:hypothetical protein [Marinilabiliaceae bacterium]